VHGASIGGGGGGGATLREAAVNTSSSGTSSVSSQEENCAPQLRVREMVEDALEEQRGAAAAVPAPEQQQRRAVARVRRQAKALLSEHAEARRRAEREVLRLREHLRRVSVSEDAAYSQPLFGGCRSPSRPF
jgi:hypothetical protein